MQEIIVGSEALAAGVVTRQTLRTKYVKLHYNVYARAGMRLDATDRARAAWLWSRRTATLVGSSAAAMHGSLWLPDHVPAELAHARQPAPPGILIHRGAIADDEICLVELRLLLVRDGLPRPVTQVQVGKRRIDMGWPEWKVGVEYDGAQHWTDPERHAEDIERLEYLAAQGWTIVRVSARQLRYDRPGIVMRVRRALAQYL